MEKALGLAAADGVKVFSWPQAQALALAYDPGAGTTGAGVAQYPYVTTMIAKHQKTSPESNQAPQEYCY